MSKVHCIVLGAGISGLSLAWYLQKFLDERVSITILEKGPRVGGWIQTISEEKFLFELGPRGCRPKGSGVELLHLIKDLALQDQVVVSQAHQRYLWMKNQLMAVPSSPLSLLFSSLGRVICRGLIKDWRTPSKTSPNEESIEAFFSRRFGKEFAHTLVDPFVLGIYAGDFSQLSFPACFPRLDEMEKKYGSISKGMLKERKNGAKDPLENASLISFKDGMQTLTERLKERVNASILLETPVELLHFKDKQMGVMLKGGKEIKGDFVFSTLPAHALKPLVEETSGQMSHLLSQIKAESIDVIAVAFDKKVIPYQGFGFLAPSKEQQKILGMVWDSCVFPHQNQYPEETRLTVMLKGKGDTLDHSIAVAKESIRHHLKIQDDPQIISAFRADQAIPQYRLDHLNVVHRLEETAQSFAPQFTFLGHSFYGVSVCDCISSAKRIAENFARRLQF